MDDKYKILITHSEGRVREALAVEFSSTFDVFKAASGEETLSFVLKENRPDLVLLSSVLPDMPFEEVVNKIHSLELTHGVACITLFDKPDPLALDPASIYPGEGKAEAILAAVQVLFRAYFRMKTQLELLESLSMVDGLTMIPNRARFNEELERNLARRRRENKTISIVLLEVDFFPEYVNCYGKGAGDVCLQTIAYAIASRVKRASDFQARYENHRFAMLLYGAELDNALEIARSLCSEIEELHMAHEASPLSSWVTATAGVASTSPLGKLDDRTLIRAGEVALERAKEAGRNGAAGVSADALMNQEYYGE